MEQKVTITRKDGIIYERKLRKDMFDCRVAFRYHNDKIEILKQTKSGEAIVDIRPLIRSASVVCDDGIIRINCVLSASPDAYLNPEHVIKYLKQSCGILSDPCLTNEYYSIMRENAYYSDMSEFR